MGKGRLEAFTDGVVAIIITIMVLELKVPHGAGLAALAEVAPVFFVYALSFANVAIFWNNHHHMLHAAKRVDGWVLWANMVLLFWLSLVPFTLRWMDETHFAAMPTASYGVVLTGAAIGYIMLERAIICLEGPDSTLGAAIKSGWKEKVSFGLYVAAIPLAFVSPAIAIALYVASAILWFVPDERIARLNEAAR
jgi:uncharacterized membrane protein